MAPPQHRRHSTREHERRHSHDRDRDRRHSRQEDGHRPHAHGRRQSSVSRQSRDDSRSRAPPSVSEYQSDVSEDVVDHHGHRHHEKFMLVQGGGGQQQQQHPQKEHIEVIIRQPPPQQIQFPPTPAPAPAPQPIFISEHNPWLTEADEAGPSAKKKRTSIDQEAIQVAEGTGKSMAPLTDAQRRESLKGKVEFKDDDKHKGKVGGTGWVNEWEGGDDEEAGLEPTALKDKENSLEVKRQYGEPCPLCGTGVLKEEFTWTGWLCATLCFPCGIFLLFSSKAVTCSHCRQVFRL